MTYSIVARDPDAGLMGAAVQSHFFAAGAHVISAKPGVGVVAVQSFADRRYVDEGMRVMATDGAQMALSSLLSSHPKGQRRAQVGLMPSSGQPAAHTGDLCVGEAGHEVVEDVSAQANMVASSQVWLAMIQAFEEANGALDVRLLAALAAAEQEGGDWRGQQSAALRVVPISETGERTPVIDLRVDDHSNPLAEIVRLNDLREASVVMERGIGMASGDDVDGALGLLDRAQQVYGLHNREPDFWAAVVEARDGRFADAEHRLRRVHQTGKGWVSLFERLPDADLLDIEPATLTKMTAALER